MRQATPTADEIFRNALATVRAYPLSPAIKPAFTLPSVPVDAPAPASGAVSGPANDIWATSERLRNGALPLRALVAGCEDLIAGHDERLHAFEYLADTGAELALLAHELEAGRPRGPLHGIPIGIKDIIDVAGMPTSGSSRGLSPTVAPADATAVARLRAAGALLVGKTVTHEFALGVTTPQSRSPWDEERVPGGSSGGAVISVVTGMCLGALGTDTRASIRVPAALSGAVGFRPTTGLIPIDRWLTLSWTMDVLAPLARSVRDIALLMDVLTQGDGRFRGGLPGSLAGRTVAYADCFLAGCEDGTRDCFEAALAAVERAGGRVVASAGLSPEELHLSNVTGMVLSRVEAAQFHAEAGTDLALCTPETREQLTEAGQALATDYVRCLRLRSLLYDRLLSLFEGADFILTPTSKVTAPLRTEAERYLLVLSENCIHWSLVGFPAISLYAGQSNGLPTGVQLIARPGHDAGLLAAAHALERELPALPEWRP